MKLKLLKKVGQKLFITKIIEIEKNNELFFGQNVSSRSLLNFVLKSVNIMRGNLILWLK